MVIKGRARGGPVALAKHLERRDTNEQVLLREVRGVTARDVKGALREMDCMGAGAVSTRTLYHAAINTAPNERLTADQKQQAIDRLEAELGFAGQPRIVVEHLKKGREHIHVVFLRIDTDRMIAISDSHNYRRHEIVARDLERKFGHELIQGAHIGREDQERPQRTPGHAEMQQAERSGLSPQAAKEQITRLWHQADSDTAFAAAVKNEGWVLAKGDKRDFVLIDPAGETHSLARRIEGAKAADVRQRMSGVDPATLPSVAEAKAVQRTLATAGPNKRLEEKVIGAPVRPKPVTVKGAAPPISSQRAVQTKSERLTDVAKAAVANEVRSTQQIRERLKLKKKLPQTKLQRLYGAAARATTDVLGKAKKLFNRKPRPKPPEKLQAKPAEARKPDRITATKTPNRPAKVAKPVRSPTPKPDKKPMTPAELDAMLSRSALNGMTGGQAFDRALHDRTEDRHLNADDGSSDSHMSLGPTTALESLLRSTKG